MIQTNLKGGDKHYKAKTSLGEVNFIVPQKDQMVSNGKEEEVADDFKGNEISAQLLIRWIVE